MSADESLRASAITEHDGVSAAELRCDFCGEPADRVRRIALHGDYERLRTRHRVRYACEVCSDRKDRVRSGLYRG